MSKETQELRRAQAAANQPVPEPKKCALCDKEPAAPGALVCVECAQELEDMA